MIANRSVFNNQTKISDVEITDDTLTGRGGLALFVRYLRGVRIFDEIENMFGHQRRSRKGQPVCEIFKQILCFFMDGSSRHVSYFDHLKKDAGYAAGIETEIENMQSTSAIQRFMRVFTYDTTGIFRRLLKGLFLWRLKIKKPGIVILGIDTMVMDNDEAVRREGVEPTYKKKKGFQPLQMTWERHIVDAIFRSGSKHSNYSDHVEKMIHRVVMGIREGYRSDVPVVICFDSGFFDQDIFAFCEKLGVGYICGGKLYSDIKTKLAELPADKWNKLENGDQVWEYTDFIDRRESWEKPRRAIFCHPLYEDKQMVMEFVRPDTIIYTNLGMGEAIDAGIVAANREDMFDAETIVATYHDRGADELVHRALKDFASETLPFKRFNQNAAWYFMMLIAFFMFETFKEDVCDPVIPLESYATTFRRQVIDIAAKIVTHAGRIVIRVTRAVWDRIKIDSLWDRCFHPPIFSMT